MSVALIKKVPSPAHDWFKSIAPENHRSIPKQTLHRHEWHISNLTTKSDFPAPVGSLEDSLTLAEIDAAKRWGVGERRFLMHTQSTL